MLKYWLAVKKDKLQMWLAWQLPKWLVKWAAVRLIAHATTGEYSSTVVLELTAIDALNRWERCLMADAMLAERAKRSVE